MPVETTKTSRGIDLIDNPNEDLSESQKKISSNFQKISDDLDKAVVKGDNIVTQTLIDKVNGNSADVKNLIFKQTDGIAKTIDDENITVGNSKLLDGKTLSEVRDDKLDKSGGTMTGAITAIRETQISLGVSSAIDLSLGNLFTKSINSNTTISVLNCLSSGTSNSFILELVNAGAFTITWFSGIKWADGFAPILTASGVDVLGFYSYDGGVTWKGLVLGNNMK